MADFDHLMAGMFSRTRAKKRKRAGGTEQGDVMEHLTTLAYVHRKPKMGMERLEVIVIFPEDLQSTNGSWVLAQTEEKCPGLVSQCWGTFGNCPQVTCIGFRPGQPLALAVPADAVFLIFLWKQRRGDGSVVALLHGTSSAPYFWPCRGARREDDLQGLAAGASSATTCPLCHPGIAQHRGAWHRRAQHGTRRHGMAQQGACRGTNLAGTARPSHMPLSAG